MSETLLDRIARAIGRVPIRQTEEGLNVYLGGAVPIEMAAAALSLIQPEMERLRMRIAELEGGTVRVLPAKFVTDAMAAIPDELPPDFA